MAGNVLQSGSITPGHLAVFAADGVIQDGGTPLAQARVLAHILGDFNNTGDQSIILPSTIQAFAITNILVTNASIALTTAAGGFYPQAGKAGSAIVAAGQVYSSLGSPNTLLFTTLTAFGSGTRFSPANLTNNTLYFSLTTGQGAPASADIYVVGIDLSVYR